MRLLNIEVTNFGSYPHFALDLSNLGLALIQGKTGAGKSTIMDAVCWTLFGVTAKDGNADDIRPWTTDEVTKGEILVESEGETLHIIRIRGKGQNDLYYYTPGILDRIRGKDLTDTQKLLEKRLGVTADLFIAASYFHEFSPTGSFFVAKAKDRRVLFEKLAPLELPKKLAEKASSARKTVKDEIETKRNDRSKVLGRIEQLHLNREAARRNIAVWRRNQDKLIDNTKRLSGSYEETKQARLLKLADDSLRWETEKEEKIEEILTRLDRNETALHQAENCPQCNQPVKAVQEAILRQQLDLQKLENLNSLINPFPDYLEQLTLQVNPYIEQLAVEMDKENPHQASLATADKQLGNSEELLNSTEASIKALEGQQNALTHLYDISSILRGELLKNAIRGIETATNGYLEKYFDAEIRVLFSANDADNIEVEIQKSGHMCNYKQLSKGQRGLLKLSFVVSVMQASANKAGIKLHNAFMDESLDGLDSDLKIKAFGLLQELAGEYESILVIDHAPEFQNLFNKRFIVTMEGDNSKIEESL